MYKQTLLFSYALLLSYAASAQNGRYELGARANGMGHTTVTLSDEMSLFNNIGALAEVEETIGFISYQNNFGFTELNTFGAGFVKPMFGGVVGIGVFKYGGAELNEQKINLGFSNQFGIVSLGLNVHYTQMNVEGAGRKGIMMIDFGGKASLTEQLVFGAFVSNINQGELSSISGEKIPTIMRAGISYRPIDELKLNTDIEKELDREAQLKIGIEYKIIEKVQVRTGIKLKPFESSFGLGVDQGKLKINYALRNNPETGDIHELSLGYRFK